MCHRLGMAGGGWRTSRTAAREVVSLLDGACSVARSVALDPFPEMLADGLVGLVTLDRRRFLGRVTRRTRASGNPQAG